MRVIGSVLEVQVEGVRLGAEKLRGLEGGSRPGYGVQGFGPGLGHPGSSGGL